MCFKAFPLDEIKAHADLVVDLWVDPVGELESEGEQEFIGTEELSCYERASDEIKIMAGNNGKDPLQFHGLSRRSSRFPIWSQRDFFARGGEQVVSAW